VGKVPYERMADYYRAADVCVSIPSSDGSPRSVWEAMGCGRACVVSDLPWLYDLLRPGKDVIAVPIDPEAVATEVLGLLGDPARRERVGARARALVEEHLDREREMDRLADLYLRLVRRPVAA
jgi:glycosyltransferase involved in cell wall biosynthesis